MNYVYVVMSITSAVVDINSAKIVDNMIFSTQEKADEYRKVLVENYPYNEAYYNVESIEVE